MDNASPPSENKQQQQEGEEEVVTEAMQDPQLPDECVPPTVAPVPSEGQSELAPHVHSQAWLLEMLDDVRYLISCTNWY